MLVILLATYGAVFTAELIGDKFLYTVGVLSARYRMTPVLCGIVVAFMLKMAVAVAVGNVMSELPRRFIAFLTAASFTGLAIAIWLKPRNRPQPLREDTRASKAAIVSFSAVFFAEWGDIGQITAATLATRFGAPILVWIGAVTAMVTKAAFAASAGAGLRQWLRAYLTPRVARYAGVSVLAILGTLSVVETLTGAR